ncbi:cysteine desulfurase family protein [Lentilactobacillus hilgardii]|uniref:cysteine desulfurase family protein n=1 Tax=Lentilactobacillus hilgardii TaxID=1588 RepID=UPI003FA5CC57
MIYFDHVATTPMSTEALDTYREVAENFFANSESLHQAGNAAGQLVQESKAKIADLLHVPVEGLIFTSGGTQSNQLGIRCLATGSSKKEILVSPLEHSSVYQILNYLADTMDYQIKFLPVDQKGHITPTILQKAITDQTGLIVIQAVNAITGIVQDIQALKQLASDAHVPLFVDAVQGLAKIPLDLSGLAGFSASAHKFNGPKSCGLLYLSPQVMTKAPYKYVFQQNGFLPGTLAVPEIVSATVALTNAWDAMADNLTHVGQLKKQLLSLLAPTICPVASWSEYPGVCGLILPHTPGQNAATSMGQQGFCFSTVSACSIKDPRPDRTLVSLGLTPEQTNRYIRVSFGPSNRPQEVASFADALNRTYS